MKENEILVDLVKTIKENLQEQKDKGVRIGLYMALNSLRNIIISFDEDLLKELDLEEELEKYL